MSDLTGGRAVVELLKAEQVRYIFGIGPTRAAAILQERQARGPFASVEELSRVPGLGPAAIARLRDRVAVR